MSKELQKAVEILVNALNTDPEYRRAWQANIAMSYVDCVDQSNDGETTHSIANKAAEHFLNILCGDLK